MNPGDLRHQVTIQEKVVSHNAYGEEVITWAEHATVWAAVEPLAGREYLDARRAQADIDVQIRIRYCPGVKPSMRVVWGSRTFQIESVIHIKEQQREMQLMCRELIEG